MTRPSQDDVAHLIDTGRDGSRDRVTCAGPTLVAATDHRLYHVNSAGATTMKERHDRTVRGGSVTVRDVAWYEDTLLYAYGDGRIYEAATDTVYTESPHGQFINSITIQDDTVYDGRGSDLYRSVDNRQVADCSAEVAAIGADDDALYAAVVHGTDESRLQRLDTDETLFTARGRITDMACHGDDLVATLWDREHDRSELLRFRNWTDPVVVAAHDHWLDAVTSFDGTLYYGGGDRTAGTGFLEETGTGTGYGFDEPVRGLAWVPQGCTLEVER